MRKNQDKSSFWYCIKPILMYFGVTLCVESLALTFIIYKENIDFSTYDMIEIANFFADITLKYSSQITIATCLVLIFFGLKLFVPNEYSDFDKRYKGSLQPTDFLSLLLTGIGFYCMITVLLTIIFGTSEYSYDKLVESTFSSGVITTLIAVIVLQPVAWEIIFRGLIFNRFRSFAPTGLAVVVSASIFSSVGFVGINQLIYLFLLGLLLSYSYTKYQSIFAPVIIHCTFYACDMLTTLKPVFDFIGTKTGTIVFYSAGFACFALGFSLIKKHTAPQIESDSSEEISAE